MEVTKKVDHHKNIEKKGGYEGKIFKMDTKWVRSFPKRSQTTLLVTITRYPQKQSGLQAHITNAHNTLKKTSEKYHKTTKPWPKNQNRIHNMRENFINKVNLTILNGMFRFGANEWQTTM